MSKRKKKTRIFLNKCRLRKKGRRKTHEQKPYVCQVSLSPERNTWCTSPCFPARLHQKFPSNKRPCFSPLCSLLWQRGPHKGPPDSQIKALCNLDDDCEIRIKAPFVAWRHFTPTVNGNNKHGAVFNLNTPTDRKSRFSWINTSVQMILFAHRYPVIYRL